MSNSKQCNQQMDWHIQTDEYKTTVETLSEVLEAEELSSTVGGTIQGTGQDNMFNQNAGLLVENFDNPFVGFWKEEPLSQKTGEDNVFNQNGAMMVDITFIDFP